MAHVDDLQSTASEAIPTDGQPLLCRCTLVCRALLGDSLLADVLFYPDHVRLLIDGQETVVYLAEATVTLDADSGTDFTLISASRPNRQYTFSVKGGLAPILVDLLGIIISKTNVANAIPLALAIQSDSVDKASPWNTYLSQLLIGCAHSSHAEDLVQLVLPYISAALHPHSEDTSDEEATEFTPSPVQHSTPTEPLKAALSRSVLDHSRMSSAALSASHMSTDTLNAPFRHKSCQTPIYSTQEARIADALMRAEVATTSEQNARAEIGRLNKLVSELRDRVRILGEKNFQEIRAHVEERNAIQANASKLMEQTQVLQRRLSVITPLDSAQLSALLSLQTSGATSPFNVPQQQQQHQTALSPVRTVAMSMFDLDESRTASPLQQHRNSPSRADVSQLNSSALSALLRPDSRSESRTSLHSDGPFTPIAPNTSQGTAPIAPHTVQHFPQQLPQQQQQQTATTFGVMLVHQGCDPIPEIQRKVLHMKPAPTDASSADAIGVSPATAATITADDAASAATAVTATADTEPLSDDVRNAGAIVRELRATIQKLRDDMDESFVRERTLQAKVARREEALRKAAAHHREFHTAVDRIRAAQSNLAEEMHVKDSSLKRLERDKRHMNELLKAKDQALQVLAVREAALRQQVQKDAVVHLKIVGELKEKLRSFQEPLEEQLMMMNARSMQLQQQLLHQTQQMHLLEADRNRLAQYCAANSNITAEQYEQMQQRLIVQARELQLAYEKIQAVQQQVLPSGFGSDHIASSVVAPSVPIASANVSAHSAPSRSDSAAGLASLLGINTTATNTAGTSPTTEQPSAAFDLNPSLAEMNLSERILEFQQRDYQQQQQQQAVPASQHHFQQLDTLERQIHAVHGLHQKRLALSHRVHSVSTISPLQQRGVQSGSARKVAQTDRLREKLRVFKQTLV
eukprot:TRINITY_DN1579_c4_g1_i1.p1 TRINITY_DN1579_c4_g1~~TRINITY_DN1579_c4_g1_i1.p1  ORF type:complete len:921 (-),score=249.85 TRINITY_DN1579_c4_g1_i1:28-2790(-)